MIQCRECGAVCTKDEERMLSYSVFGKTFCKCTLCEKKKWENWKQYVTPYRRILTREEKTGIQSD